MADPARGDKVPKIFVRSTLDSEGNWLYRMWREARESGEQFRFKPDFGKLADEIEKEAARLRRQQVHIDEIKRLCHVK